MSRNTVPTVDIRRYASDPFAFFADAMIPGPGRDVQLGDCWADFQRDAFRILADCIQAVSAGSKPPFRGLWVERTKGASKDSDVGLALLWTLMFSRRPQMIELGADDQDQILEIFKSMVSIVRVNPWMAPRLTFRAERIVCEATASEAVFLTRDASGSHGSRPTVTVCNELAHCQSEEFVSTMMDNADKFPRNFCVIATNAGTLGSWQYRWRENYRTDPAWWFQKVDSVAPWIDAAKVRDAERRNPPARFARLWRGQWVSPGGDLLSPEQIRRSVVHGGPLWQRPDVQDFQVCGIGVDLAATGRHHAAVVVLVGSYRTGKLRTARVIDFKPPVSIGLVKDAILRMGLAYRTRAVFMDAWQGIRLAEELSSFGYDVTAQQQTGVILSQQAGALLQVFQDELLELHTGERDSVGLLLKDLLHARLIEKSYGHKVEFTETEDGHGDRLSAMLQCLPAMLRGLGGLPSEAYEELQANLLSRRSGTARARPGIY